MNRSIAFLGALSCAFGLSPVPAGAGNDLGEFVSIEVLDGGLTGRGTHQAALRVVLADGWKTYWRAPGDAGIPPRFEWGGSRNVEDIAISWPTPLVFDQFGMRSLGYERQVVLPLEITTRVPGQPVHLKGEMEFGLCKDICVPASLAFEMPLDPDAPGNPAIAATLGQRPFSATEAGVADTTCLLSAAANGMTMRALVTMPSAGGDEEAVIEPGDDDIWASQATTQRSGGVLTVVSELEHVAGAGFALDYSRVRITVLGRNYAVDILGCTPG